MDFDEIYNNTYDKVLNYVTIKCDNISNIMDIMQNIYLNLYNNLNKYKIDNIDAFLIKLAKNELFKYYSLKNKLKYVFNKNINNAFDDSLTDIPDKTINVEEQAINNYMIDEIFSEIKKLDILTQKIITLHYLQEEKIKMIALLLGMNESTIKSKLYRGLESIKKNLKGGYIDE